MAVITGRENTYFERTFEALGVSEEVRTTTPNTAAQSAFERLMLGAAKSGSLAQMLAVLVVCEWSYQTWGERVLTIANAANEELPFYCREWIDLHSGTYFGSVVEYLRGLLDREAATLVETELMAVRTRFVEAVQAELDFFDSCYEE